MLEYEKPGYITVSLHPLDGRRGLWMRTDDHANPKYIELCAGREGDDDHTIIKLGDRVDEVMLARLFNLLQTVAYGHECGQHAEDRAVGYALIDLFSEMRRWLREIDGLPEEDYTQSDADYCLLEKAAQVATTCVLCACDMDPHRPICEECQKYKVGKIPLAEAILSIKTTPWTCRR